MSTSAAVRAVRTARRDRSRVLLEGIHALKHAVRFGANIEVVLTAQPDELTRLLTALAPDVLGRFDPTVVDDAAWDDATGRELPSPAIAVATRPHVDASDVMAADGTVVVLEQPRHLGNLGAVVRVAAAADAGGVLVIGGADPWHPTAVRGGAGLQYALPVARADVLPATDRSVVALDGDGDPATRLPDNAVLLVGTERGGLTDAMKAGADLHLALPMREGVSSLNLATAVAVALYR